MTKWVEKKNNKREKKKREVENSLAQFCREKKMDADKFYNAFGSSAHSYWLEVGKSAPL